MRLVSKYPKKKKGICLTPNFHNLIVNSPLKVLQIQLIMRNLVLDQNNNFYLVSLSIFITFLLGNV